MREAASPSAAAMVCGTTPNHLPSGAKAIDADRLSPGRVVIAGVARRIGLLDDDVALTSMDMVNLMLGVEAEFDFTIPQSEITPENFQSVKTLERMIVSQLQLEAVA